MPTLDEYVNKAVQLSYVSCTKTLSWHWRMNLQHTVQHLLNVSLARLQTNNLWEHVDLHLPRYFEIVPAHLIRTKSQKNMFICICGCWKRSHDICVNSGCLCSNVIANLLLLLKTCGIWIVMNLCFHYYYRRPYVYQCGDLDKLMNTVLEKVESLPVERVAEVLNGFLERYIPVVLL